MRCGYYLGGLWLFGIGALVLLWNLQIAWKERRHWIYETHKGRDVEVRRHFRDEYLVIINGRCARIYVEMLGDNGVAIAFEGLQTWETGGRAMTQEERVDVLNILLEELEMRGIRAEFFDAELPDTPQVRAALQRLEEGSQVTLTSHI